MPLVNPTPAVPPVEAPHDPRVVSPSYKGVTVDTKYIPSSALLTHIQGSSMQVAYYSQILDNDTDLNGQNPNRNPILQPYRLIKDMELKVTTPLTAQQINETKAMGMTGEANVYPFLIPNQGDMFLTDIGDGREGIFRVTEVERKSIFKDTCYTIRYEFVEFSDTSEGQFRIADFKAKTLITYVYMKEFLQYGQNPVLLEEDAAMVENLTYIYGDIVKQWFKEFTSREFSTFMVPGQEFATYDSFLTKAVSKLFNVMDAPEMQFIRVLNDDGDDNMKTPTVWDMCLQRNVRVLRMLNRQMGLAFAKNFQSDPMMEGIYHSGVGYVVYPIDPRTSWDDKLKMKPELMTTYSLVDVPSIAGSLDELVTDAELEGLPYEGRPLIKQVLVDQFYIFSEAFYKQDTANMSRLEAAIWDFLNRKPINLRLLYLLCDTYQTWGGLERFYYTPFVLMLIRGVIRSL
jgi:hypothetical protein